MVDETIRRFFLYKKYLVNSVSDGAKAIDFSITEEKQLLAI